MHTVNVLYGTPEGNKHTASINVTNFTIDLLLPEECSSNILFLGVKLDPLS